jgi:hypothetical protein
MKPIHRKKGRKNNNKGKVKKMQRRNKRMNSYEQKSKQTKT